MIFRRQTRFLVKLKALIRKSKCERGDSNPYGCPLAPKASASASSATLAALILRHKYISGQIYRRLEIESA